VRLFHLLMLCLELTKIIIERLLLKKVKSLISVLIKGNILMYRRLLNKEVFYN